MSHKDLDRKAYWRSLILDLQMSAEETQNHLALLEHTPPHHGIRAAMIASLGVALSARAPHVRAAFDAYESTLPKTAFFSFMPVMEVAARFSKAASLIDPTALNQQDLTNSLTRVSVRTLATAPFMQAMIVAAEGDMRAFFRSLAGDAHTVENFGSREVDIDTPNRFRLLYRDHNTRFGAYYVRGAAQGNCDWFKIPAEVTFEPLSDTAFFIDTCW
jgi:hypothetical protein